MTNRVIRNMGLGLTLAFGLAAIGMASKNAASWSIIAAKDAPTARHEAAFSAHKEKLYLLGGRRINPVDVYDIKSNSWIKKSMAPREFHHVQMVTIGDAIYIIGAFEGRYPAEQPIDRVLIYYPKEDRFAEGAMIPKERRRGAAGIAVYNGKIYMLGGSTNGHIDGYQPWFDEFDPKTSVWRTLPDAPDPRDHFQSVVIGDKLYALGGRLTEQKIGKVFENTVARGNVFNFKTGRWDAVDDAPIIPTPRAGLIATGWKHWVVLAGGESGTRDTAHDEVEAFNTRTGKWESWPKFVRGRHGTGIALVKRKAYVAAGSGNRGGQPELDTIEAIKLP
ncbi:MAG: galactose oxidase [Sphingomonadales bacterium]|nr:galactose oxidase [Sphingomonadales bacterium]